MHHLHIIHRLAANDDLMQDFLCDFLGKTLVNVKKGLEGSTIGVFGDAVVIVLGSDHFYESNHVRALDHLQE